MSSRFSSIETHGWQLDSAEERNAENPDTFEIPPREQRDSLRPGEAAKLLFEIEAEGERGVERMWVVVRGRVGDRYIGILDSTPSVDGHELVQGTEVVFGPQHVADISVPPREYLVEKYGEDFFGPPGAA